MCAVRIPSVADSLFGIRFGVEGKRSHVSAISRSLIKKVNRVRPALLATFAFVPNAALPDLRRK